MIRKAIPYFFLFFLLLIIAFIIGVKYGTKVEKANKVVDNLLKQETAKKALPTPTPDKTTYISYESKMCGLKFLLPTTVTKDKNVLESFVKNGKTVLTITCLVTSPSPRVTEDKIATEEIQLKNKTLVSQVKNGMYSFQTKNTINNKTVTITIDKNLYPLFANTLEFMK